MSVLGPHFERVRNSLMNKSDEIGIADHRSLKGTARELIVSDFMAANLPRSFDFVSGEIVTPHPQHRSGQIDILILPHTAPRLQLSGSISIGLVHAVAAAFEIKSNLTTSGPDSDSELTKAMQSVAKVKSLPLPRDSLNPWPWSARMGDTSVQLAHIPMGIVAIDGPKIDTLRDHLHKWMEKNGRDKLPNTVTCLREDYTLILNDGWASHVKPGHLYLNSDGTGDCLGLLFDHLMKTLQSWYYAQPRTPMSQYFKQPSTG